MDPLFPPYLLPATAGWCGARFCGRTRLWKAVSPGQHGDGCSQDDGRQERTVKINPSISCPFLSLSNEANVLPMQRPLPAGCSVWLMVRSTDQFFPLKQIIRRRRGLSYFKPSLLDSYQFTGVRKKLLLVPEAVEFI